MKYNIYIGFDSRNYGQKMAAKVCEESIYKTTNIKKEDLNINFLVLKDLIKKGQYYRDVDPLASTEFTISRFLVPYLNGFKGWALFCDSDFLYRCDIKNIFNYIKKNKDKAVCVVKHPRKLQKSGTKMNGIIQSAYPRKNWSSLMLFNCSHPSTKNLTLQNVNEKSPKYLHRFEWCKSSEIGNINVKYNFLADNYISLELNKKYKGKKHTVKKPCAIHYTDGGPWHIGTLDGDYGDLWLNYLTSKEKNKLDTEICNKMHKKKCSQKEILNVRKKTVKNSVRNVNTISKKKNGGGAGNQLIGFNNSLNKINTLNFYNDPYPHIVIENFLESDLFQDLRNNFPDNGFNSNNHIDSVHKDDNTRFVLKLNNLEDCQDFHQSYKIIYSLFSSREYLDKVSKLFQKKIPKSRTEMQIIKDKSNYKITPHCDTHLQRHKYLTSLFYLPDDNISEDLGTELYIPDKDGEIDGTGGHYDLQDPTGYPKKFKLIKKVKYRPNTLLIFMPEHQVSWHGVSQIKLKNGLRKTLQIFQKVKK